MKVVARSESGDVSRHRPRAWIDRIGGGNSEHLVKPARRRGSGPASSGNSWLSLLLPFAIKSGERIDFTLAVDRCCWRTRASL